MSRENYALGGYTPNVAGGYNPNRNEQQAVLKQACAMPTTATAQRDIPAQLNMLESVIDALFQLHLETEKRLSSVCQYEDRLDSEKAGVAPSSDRVADRIASSRNRLELLMKNQAQLLNRLQV